MIVLPSDDNSNNICIDVLLWGPFASSASKLQIIPNASCSIIRCLNSSILNLV